MAAGYTMMEGRIGQVQRHEGTKMAQGKSEKTSPEREKDVVNAPASALVPPVISGK